MRTFHHAWLSVSLLLAACPLPARAQASAPSAQDIVQRLTPGLPDAAGNEETYTRSLSARLRPDPNTGLCEAGAAAAGGGSAGSADKRTLYVEKAPAIDLDIAFDHNSAVLRAAGRKLLDTLAEALRDPSLAKARFVVAGHTNMVGEEDHNRRLSCARALAARDYLRDKRGIVAARLIPMGFGYSRLKPDLEPAAEANRRVEIRKAPE